MKQADHLLYVFMDSKWTKQDLKKKYFAEKRLK